MLKMNVLLYILLAFPTLAFSQIKYFEIGDTLTVLAKSGLSLRDSNSVTAKKVGLASFGQTVIVTGNDLYSDVIEDRFGWWIKVSLKGKNGFMFSGYLSQIKLPKSFIELPGCCRYPYLEEIIRLNVDSLVGQGERNWEGFA